MNGVWYYFLSSLPAEEPNSPSDRFYGLSPTGLARGGTLDDYEGIYKYILHIYFSDRKFIDL